MATEPLTIIDLTAHDSTSPSYPNSHSPDCTNPRHDCRAHSLQKKCGPCQKAWFKDPWKKPSPNSNKSQPKPALKHVRNGGVTKPVVKVAKAAKVTEKPAPTADEYLKKHNEYQKIHDEYLKIRDDYMKNVYGCYDADPLKGYPRRVKVIMNLRGFRPRTIWHSNVMLTPVPPKHSVKHTSAWKPSNCSCSRLPPPGF